MCVEERLEGFSAMPNSGISSAIAGIADLTLNEMRGWDSDVQPAAPKALFHTELRLTKEFIIPQREDFIDILFSFKWQQK